MSITKVTLACQMCRVVFSTPDKRQKFCSQRCAKRQLQRPHQPLAARFWQKVERSGAVPAHQPHLGQCWIWKASRCRKGYGQFRISATTEGVEPALKGRTSSPIGAHRVAFFLEYGRWPEPCCLHACDGGASGCVRPSHLFEGSKSENALDMWRKGRGRPTGSPGERHVFAKLTEDSVRDIRALAQAGVQHKSIAARFGVSRSAVGFVVQRKTWRHVA